MRNALFAADAGIAGVVDAAAHWAERVRGPAEHRVPVDEWRDACLPHEGMDSETDRARIATFFWGAAGVGCEVVADCGSIGFGHIATVELYFEDCTIVLFHSCRLLDMHRPSMGFR